MCAFIIYIIIKAQDITGWEAHTKRGKNTGEETTEEESWKRAQERKIS